MRTSAWLTSKHRSMFSVKHSSFPDQLESLHVDLADVELPSGGVQGMVLYRYVESDGSTRGGQLLQAETTTLLDEVVPRFRARPPGT